MDHLQPAPAPGRRRSRDLQQQQHISCVSAVSGWAEEGQVLVARVGLQPEAGRHGPPTTMVHRLATPLVAAVDLVLQQHHLF